MNNHGYRNNNYFADNQNNFNFPSNYRDTYSGGHGRGGGRGQQSSPQHNRYRRIKPSYQQDRGYTENARMFYPMENNDRHQKWSSSNKPEGKFAKFKDPNKKETRTQKRKKKQQKLVHSRSSKAATTTMLNDQKSLNSHRGNNVPLIHTKGEHIEEDSQEKSTKQKAPPASLNSLNSLGKTKAEPSLAEEVETTTNKIHTLNMANTQSRNKYEKSTDPPRSSLLSATSEVNSEKSCPEDRIIAKLNTTESIKTDEDIVCLGKLENKFVVEDDVDDDNGDITSAVQDQCMICDKKGHSSFQCQMICMNCSAPYHNLKSCPKPSNLTVMLQTFMDFCMHQLMEFSPEQRFFTPQEVCANSSHFTPFSKRKTSSCVGLSTLGLPVAPANFAKHKRTQFMSKNLKKKRKKRTKSENSDEEDANKRDSSVDDTSASDSKSDSSEELPAEPRAKRATTKMLMQTAYSSPFSSLPEYVSPVAAAAAYNPIMFNQMLHGAFPMHAPINFNR